ncbi:MAG: MBL fold metallo-hydrolase [Pseudonocardia sp.]|nr:MBL fold metallo-hydrolase [Pseudonocardia sp.]
MTGSLTFIGNATVLLRWGQLTVLTDPNFLHRGQRAYLGYGLSSRRLTEPALDVAELPALDAVVLSHMHGDHWDRVARRGLPRQVPVITTRQAARRLRWQGFRASQGLRTWQTSTVRSGESVLTVTALPARHAPGPAQLLLPPVMGSLLEFSRNGQTELRVYVSGDTLLFDGLSEIPRRHPNLDLSVLHLGGTRLPGGLMVTMDGRQGADLLALLEPSPAVPVHYDDYGLFSSPLSDFLAEVARRGLQDRVVVVERGQTVPLPL